MIGEILVTLMDTIAANFAKCSVLVLMAIEQWGSHSVPHLLWQGTVSKVISIDLWHAHLLPRIWQWNCHYLFKCWNLDSNTKPSIWKVNVLPNCVTATAKTYLVKLILYGRSYVKHSTNCYGVLNVCLTWMIMIYFYHTTQHLAIQMS